MLSLPRWVIKGSSRFFSPCIFEYLLWALRLQVTSLIALKPSYCEEATLHRKATYRCSSLLAQSLSFISPGNVEDKGTRDCHILPFLINKSHYDFSLRSVISWNRKRSRLCPVQFLDPIIVLSHKFWESLFYSIINRKYQWGKQNYNGKALLSAAL